MKATLDQLANQTQAWIKIIPSRNQVTIDSQDRIFVAFNKQKRSSSLVNKIVIVFGQKILKKLDAKIGDRLNVFHHPDDIMTFMVVKSSSSSGYKILKYSSSNNNAQILFKWNEPLILPQRSMEEVEFIHIQKTSQIVFRVEA